MSDDVARRLLVEAGQAALSTLSARQGTEGWPYGSLVLVARDADGTPLIVVSDLSQHSRNLAADPRASLLLDGTAGLEDPLSGPRLTLLCRAEPAGVEAIERFVARHPSAAEWARFGDMRCLRLVPEIAHLVAGFGQVRWIEPAALYA